MEAKTAETHADPQMLYERGVDFMQNGDFAAARADFKAILSLQPSRELEKKTRLMLKRLSIDLVEVGAGLAVLALLIILFTYFGLKNN